MSNTAAPAMQPSEEKGLAYKWKVLICVIFGIFMIILDSTVINVALQTLRAEYGVTLAEVQWIISIYTLALGITTPLSGFLADRFGIKRIYITGLALFTISSLFCGLAPSFLLLIVARALQGIGGGLAQPLGPAMFYRAFPPNEQGTALGYFGVALVVAPALGPILGGMLVDADLWRWIFLINLPIGLLGVLLATILLRPDQAEGHAKADPLGIVTAIIAFGSLLYAATQAAEIGWGAAEVLGIFGVGAVALLAFIINELFVAKEPLLDLRLFRNPTFAIATVIGYVTVVALFGAEFLMPVYLQVLRGRTAMESGLLLLPLAIASAIFTPLAGRLYDKIGPRMLLIVGFGLLAINTWQLSQIQALTPMSTIMWLLALRGAALGCIMQSTMATALGAVPRTMLPRGSSLINGTRFVVQSIGVALLATLLTSSFSDQTRQLQASSSERRAEGAQATSFGLCETPGVAPEQNLPPALSSQPAAVQAQARAKIDQACSEYLAGFDLDYRLTFYFALVALALGALLPGWPGPWAGRGAQQAGRATPAIPEQVG